MSYCGVKEGRKNNLTNRLKAFFQKIDCNSNSLKNNDLSFDDDP